MDSTSLQLAKLSPWQSSLNFQRGNTALCKINRTNLILNRQFANLLKLIIFRHHLLLLQERLHLPVFRLASMAKSIGILRRAARESARTLDTLVGQGSTAPVVFLIQSSNAIQISLN